MNQDPGVAALILEIKTLNGSVIGLINSIDSLSDRVGTELEGIGDAVHSIEKAVTSCVALPEEGQLAPGLFVVWDKVLG